MKYEIVGIEHAVGDFTPTTGKNANTVQHYDVYRKSSNSTYEAIGYGFHMMVVPNEVTVNKQTNITINNNTWNGNIYQDNSTNLTYIYPQYTTINENNETVTTISPTKRPRRRPRLTPHPPRNRAAILAIPPEFLLYWLKSVTI